MSTRAHEIDPSEVERGPHWVSRTAFQWVAILFFLTQGALAFAVYHRWTFIAVLLMLFASHLMHGFLIGFHEASHGLLRKNRVFNDTEGLVIGIFSFTSFTLYRVAHQTHHMYLATERDVELWPFVQPGSPRWKRRLAAFVELTAGMLYTPMIFLRAFLMPGTPVRSERMRRRVWQELAVTIVVWATVLWAVNYWGVWRYFLWMYLGPAWIAADLQSWRKYIEHVGLGGNTATSATRSIVANTWAGKLFALTLLHEPFHGVHHKHPGLPHAELPGHADELEAAEPGDVSPFPNYTHALIHLLGRLSDPKAGGQWATHPGNSCPA